MWITPAPGSTPETVCLALQGGPGLVWLDGGLEHGREGRWSFVGAQPREVVRIPWGQTEGLAALGERLRMPTSPLACDLGPSGLTLDDVPLWIGHVGYDAWWSGRSGLRLPRDSQRPIAWFARYAALFAFDHRQQRGYFVGDDPAACAALESSCAGTPSSAPEARVGAISASSRARHIAAVETALEHLRAGDVYQLNLARVWSATFDGSPLALALAMRRASPVPLGYFADAGDHALIGRSMERFVRFRSSDRALWSSPIKGTLARTGDDAEEASRLVHDDKERTEHAMIVDLVRNDLGAVAEYGSVKIERLYEVLPFAGLSHLASTITATARADMTLTQLLEATFPPASVTGTPKRRALEIIEALEPVARGAYCGAVGFVDRAGGASFAVAIRSAVVANGRVDYHAGGGIVLASDPEREADETELKAQVFLQACAQLA